MVGHARNAPVNERRPIAPPISKLCVQPTASSPQDEISCLTSMFSEESGEQKIQRLTKPISISIMLFAWAKSLSLKPARDVDAKAASMVTITTIQSR